ncbi:response regulator [Mucilaginibacter arboris]|uniref:Response regulator n=1 Tax=Mucilaginibacter arboris TaxID=2682090 RepID=A0A7K1SVL1_9SPHI|nr:response regulator [Mucilaginibacter arboris]MVN21366.1 response regulator [Mucilaginibacter arboris]
MVNKTILVCDDDQDILEMLVFVLETYGYRAVAESNSPNMFNAIKKEHPGLVIIDLWMPLMTGDEVVKQLRKSPETERLPVIVISANIDGKETADNAGANHFISKPFDIVNLIDKVEEYYAQAS